MALVTATPVPVALANIFQITRFEANTTLPALTIMLSRGFRDEAGAVTWHPPEVIDLRGDELAVAYSQAPEGATVYEVIKRALYGYLVLVGKIPADAVELPMAAEGDGAGEL